MQFQAKAWVTKLALPFAQTIINDSLRHIYEDHDWNFQKEESVWLTPGILGGTGTVAPGTVTLTIGSADVIGDATAAAAWVATTAAKLKQYQFRQSALALYNIIAFDGVNKITLDRPWMEPSSGAGNVYMIYQAYFPAPVADFKRWWVVRDFRNAGDLWTNKTQAWLASIDPQRTTFGLPSQVIPYKTDTRPGSATLGYMMYELWPHNLSIMPYSLYYSRMGPALSLPTDSAPFPITEDMILYRARVVAYEWKLANAGEDTKRGSLAQWQFLMQQAQAQYAELKRQQIKKDRDRGDPFISQIRREVKRSPAVGLGGYLNVGSFDR